MKIIIWGHKLHSHTHSYIHNAFFRAFKYLEYETYWFDNKDNIQDFNFDDCFFITEGQVDQNIPLNKTYKYLLHNCNLDKYKDQNINFRVLQVYTHDVLGRAYEKIDKASWYTEGDKTLYQAWGTDLLPSQIDFVNKVYGKHTSLESVWVGSIGDGVFGNKNEINPFKLACLDNNIKFIHKSQVSVDEHVYLINQSYLAPAIVGAWQKEKGYVPCRIFKNISYGAIGLTNSKMVSSIFEDRIIYDDDTYNLFNKGKEFLLNDKNIELRKEILNEVKEYHTYENRIKVILDLF